MNSEVQILDCTLRDGGRVIDCRFDDDKIIGIGKMLSRAGIDIIELGFLRDIDEYLGNSTYFSCTNDTEPIVKEINKYSARCSKYVLFVDYGLFDVHKLEKSEETMITGIRYGFTKKDLNANKEEIIDELRIIKNKGYDLYIQDVNTTGYSSSELLEVIKIVNDIRPISFGIVDTYGAMDLDDLEYVYSIVHHNLDSEIALDFHTHDNMEMSFALCQEIIALSANRRKLILDATLFGMGKCAGNLKTELIVDYLNRKLNADYDEDLILDAIDSYIEVFRREEEWGYSISAFMSGIFRSHPNNVMYLTDKYRLNSKDIKYILSEISEEKRLRYDYENIERVYKEYCKNKIDDTDSIQELKSVFSGRDVLIVASGKSVDIQQDMIRGFIREKSPIVVNINANTDLIRSDYYFFANIIHWEKAKDSISRENCILVSNVHTDYGQVKTVDYSRLVVEDNKYGDNSTIMLLNLLKELDVLNIYIAGFDGLKVGKENYVEPMPVKNRGSASVDEVNTEVRKLYLLFKERCKGKIGVKIITPSLYEE